MKNKNFTLVELLIVIAIIIILAAILIPTLSSAMEKAEITKGKTEITTLVNAIKQYESTYGVMPIPDDNKYKNTEDDVPLDDDKNTPSKNAYKWLILMLQAQTIDDNNNQTLKHFGTSNKYNPRKIAFLDISDTKPGILQDPWENNYKIIFDSDYNGKITTKNSGATSTKPNETIWGIDTSPTGFAFNFGVVVWSMGPDGKANNTASKKDNKDNIYSFPTIWSASGHHIDK